MAITPDGKHAYVTNNADGTVSVITTATSAVSAPITVGNAPTAVAVTPDGKHAYVTNNGDGTVSVITTTTGAVSAPITVGSRPVGVAITPDGKHVYVVNSSVDNFVTNDVVSNGAGTVSVITTATVRCQPRSRSATVRSSWRSARRRGPAIAGRDSSRRESHGKAGKALR